jgi:hypothetical protein
MGSRTTITADKSSVRLFHQSRERNGMKNNAFLRLLVRALDALSPEQRMSIQFCSHAEPASPSTGDAVQCDQRTPLNQAKTPQPRVARRKAG